MSFEPDFILNKNTKHERYVMLLKHQPRQIFALIQYDNGNNDWVEFRELTPIGEVKEKGVWWKELLKTILPIALTAFIQKKIK